MTPNCPFTFPWGFQIVPGLGFGVIIAHFINVILTLDDDEIIAIFPIPRFFPPSSGRVSGGQCSAEEQEAE